MTIFCECITSVGKKEKNMQVLRGSFPLDQPSFIGSGKAIFYPVDPNNSSQKNAEEIVKSDAEKLQIIKDLCEFILFYANEDKEYDNECARQIANEVIHIYKSNFPVSERLTIVMKKIVQINKLQIVGRELASVPDSIEYLTGLTRLELATNELENLPKTMCNLKNLKVIDISGNKNFRNFPTCLINLSLNKIIIGCNTPMEWAPVKFMNVIDPANAIQNWI